MRILFPDIKPYAIQHLAVDDLHTLYVEECGVPDGDQWRVHDDELPASGDSGHHGGRPVWSVRGLLAVLLGRAEQPLVLRVHPEDARTAYLQRPYADHADGSGDV